MLGMDREDARFNGGALYLIGSALAFGLLASAILRK
jgi:hypothetical protein